MSECIERKDDYHIVSHHNGDGPVEALPGRFQAAVTQPRPDDAEPHARSLQSSVAEGRADSGKAGPQAQSVTPARILRKSEPSYRPKKLSGTRAPRPKRRLNW